MSRPSLPRSARRPLRRRRDRVVAAVIAAAAVAVVGATAASTASAVPAPATASRGAKPTIVLIHGAFSGTASWNGEVTQLQHDGYVVRAITNPLRNLTTDSEFVADFVKTVPGPVVLVGHSYGGSVITNAAAEVRNVVGLVYVDGYEPAPGETSASLNGAGSVLNRPASDVFDAVPYPGPGVEDYLKKSVFIRNFGSDLPASTDARLWATQGAATDVAFATPSKYAAWRTIPSYAFISTGDQVITPASLLSQAHRARSVVDLFHGGSHLTLISHPAAVTALIERAAR